ncbi:MAG: hypothetical protein ACOZQL_32050 [Myxococcota bacterium]
MNLRVLVVDDDEASVRAMERTLNKLDGLEVTASADLWALTELLSTRTFEVVLGDLLTVLVARNLAPTARCYLVTDQPDEVGAAQLDALGILGVIEKPWSDRRVEALLTARR